jgi:exonuclease III
VARNRRAWLACAAGYAPFFAFHRKAIGYCGVATYCALSMLPVAAEEGFSGVWAAAGANAVGPHPEYDSAPDSRSADGSTVFSIRSLDSEGRCLVTDHVSFVLLNVYFPSFGGDAPARRDFKLQFHHAVTRRCRALLAAGRDVVIVGDVNVSHRAIDHCDPGEYVRHVGEPFHTSVFRVWMDSLLSGTCAADDDARTSVQSRARSRTPASVFETASGSRSATPDVIAGGAVLVSESASASASASGPSPSLVTCASPALPSSAVAAVPTSASPSLEQPDGVAAAPPA